MREDIDHFLKYGSFLHGEWFTGGQRCPGGDRSQPLPAGLTERPLAPPDFPEYEVALDPADGAPTQFANAENYHQVAEWRTKSAAWPAAVAAPAAPAASHAAATPTSHSGIIRRMVKHEPHHGKSGCDGNSNVPSYAIQEAIKEGALLNPSTREMVLFLAEHKQARS